jgi:hypothetical protein
MNLFWFIRYLAISFECVRPVLESVWVTSDRLQHELNLLLVPIDIQLNEWGYPKTVPVEGDYDPIDGATFYWTRTPHNNPGVFCCIQANQVIFMVAGYDDFIVNVEHPITRYFREIASTNVIEQITSRHNWIQAFCALTSPTSLGPDSFGSRIEAGLWTRSSGLWRCSP